MDAAAESAPAFAWEQWYEARGGRTIDLPDVNGLLERIYTEQATRFDTGPDDALGPDALGPLVGATAVRLRQAILSGGPEAAADAAAAIKDLGLAMGAGEIGITAIQPTDIYSGRSVDLPLAIAVGVPMRYPEFTTVPSPASAFECVRIYWDVGEVCLAIAEAIRAAGRSAVVEDPVGDSTLMHVPIALRAGFGELGRHGSIIHETMGPLFRLGTVITDLPLRQDAPVDLGIAAFCDRCKACRRFCPADAIPDDRAEDGPVDPQGNPRYQVDTGRCFPYFARELYCSACLAVCAWERRRWAKDPSGVVVPLWPEVVMVEPPGRLDLVPAQAATHAYPRLG